MTNVFYKFNQWKTNRKGEEIQERLKEKLYGREHDTHHIIEVRTDVKTFAENRVCEIHCMPIVGSVTLFDVMTLHLQDK